MKNKFIWFAVSLLTVTAMVLASCNSTSTSTTTSTASSTTTQIKTTAISAITPTTSTSVQTTTAATTAAGNWWNSLGTPQYGGTMTLRVNTDVGTFDVYSDGAQASLDHLWLENLFSYKWTMDPTLYSYKDFWTPTAYASGQLAQSYEMTDPNTFVVHLRQGIHWQNIPPANGRELIADDVVFHFDRMFGLGDGFTTPAPPNVSQSIKVFLKLQSVTADGNYSVVFKFSGANAEAMVEAMLGPSPQMTIECPDAVKLYGNTSDWHHALGTGPFMLTDYVSGSSATLTKNPNYWGYDERFPQNQLPYVNAVKYLIMPDIATALAALRSGKIDVLDGLAVSDSQSLKKTNP
jgi:ABC-type transport system substrate-binding protein